MGLIFNRKETNVIIPNSNRVCEENKAEQSLNPQVIPREVLGKMVQQLSGW